MKRYWSILLLITWAIQSQAQKITFSVPVPLAANARSDNSADLVYFQGKCYTAWKEPGAIGKVHFALGAGLPLQFDQEINITAGTIAKPALVISGNYLYLFWLDKDSTLAYSVITGQPGADNPAQQKMPGDVLRLKCTSGITAAASGGKIILGTHADNKDRLRIIVCEPQSNGTLKLAVASDIKGARSATYPVVAVNGATVRFCWSKGGQLSVQDYDAGKDDWIRLKGQYPIPANIPAAVCAVPGDSKLLYIWSNHEQQNQLQYLLSDSDGTLTDAATDLPLYFNTSQPVSVAVVDKNNFLVVFAGADQQLYISYGRVYYPAAWMEELLLPGREHYTLKDIVLPGSHDAGMSVLNGVGGKSTYTINECNTLTQLLSVQQQLEAGMRMFDLRIDLYQGVLYTKHAPSDCMDDAVGGGYGERLDTLLAAVSRFLDQHKKEFVLLSFCHFCDRHMPVEEQGKVIIAALGKDKVLNAGSRPLKDIPISEMSGKVLVSFEEHSFPGLAIITNTMTDRSDAFFNYKRAYAATNVPDRLITGQQAFLESLKGALDANDIIRLDWQLTQIGQEAALTCSQFQSDKPNLLLDGALLLTNTIKKNKSIINLALMGNRYLPGKVMEWVKDGTINKENKPNILYVDAAGNWITDFCIRLNEEGVYKK